MKMKATFAESVWGRAGHIVLAETVNIKLNRRSFRRLRDGMESSDEKN